MLFTIKTDRLRYVNQVSVQHPCDSGALHNVSAIAQNISIPHFSPGQPHIYNQPRGCFLQEVSSDIDYLFLFLK